MIKENDLRLNNLVTVNYKTDLLSKVTWIQEGSINVIFDRQPDLINGIVCSANDLIPIPVTEKILLSCGFKKQSLSGMHNCFVIKRKNNYHFTLYESENSYNINNRMLEVDIKYVHQLQNLFFSLTGEELVFSTEPLTSKYPHVQNFAPMKKQK